MEYLASGGQEGDMKELGGWENYATVARYGKANAGGRVIKAHKKGPAEYPLAFVAVRSGDLYRVYWLRFWRFFDDKQGHVFAARI